MIDVKGYDSFDYLKQRNELNEQIERAYVIKILKLQERIDKAIEYIEKFISIDNDTILMRENQRDYLLEILKGSD